MRIDVFDPEMCCSTGLCGPAPDRELIRIEEALELLRKEGAVIFRHQMSRDPQAFLGHEEVYRKILTEGTQTLPMVAVDGRLLCTGHYPTYEELRAMETTAT